MRRSKVSIHSKGKQAEAQIAKSFRIVGLNVKPQIIKWVNDEIQNDCDRDKLTQVSERLADFCKQHLRRNPTGTARTTFVDDSIIKEALPQVLAEINGVVPNNSGDVEMGAAAATSSSSTAPLKKSWNHLGDGIFIYNAFRDIPMYELNKQTNKFELSSRKPAALASAETRAHAMLDRMNIVVGNTFRARLSRDTLNDKIEDEENVIEYLDSNQSFAARQKLCRGHRGLYTVKIPVMTRRTHHAEIGKSNNLLDPENFLEDNADDGMFLENNFVSRQLRPGEQIEIDEWYVSAHEHPEWYLKLKDGSGWIPYWVRLGNAEEATIEPCGEWDKVMITNIPSLIGNCGHRITLGLLVEIDRSTKTYALQGGSKRVTLDFRHFRHDQCDVMIVHGGFYIVEGIVDNSHGILNVLKVSLPPIPRIKTQERKLGDMAMSDPSCFQRTIVRIREDVNFFGGLHSLADIDHLIELEKSEDFRKHSYCIISDVNLSDPATIDRLNYIFEKFQTQPTHPHYVLIGNFRGPNYYFDPSSANQTVESWRKLFNKFFNLLQNYPHTRDGKRIILVPGPSDRVGNLEILPQRPLQSFQEPVPSNVHLTTNPCRVRHFGHKLVFSRTKIQDEILEAEVLPFNPNSGARYLEQNEDGDVQMKEVEDSQIRLHNQGIARRAIKNIGNPLQARFEAMARYLLAQGHLSPILPASHCSTLQGFDHTMALNPPPDLLVMGGGDKNRSCMVGDTDVLQVGSFTKFNQWAFYLYYPFEEQEEARVQIGYALAI